MIAPDHSAQMENMMKTHSDRPRLPKALCAAMASLAAAVAPLGAVIAPLAAVTSPVATLVAPVAAVMAATPLAAQSGPEIMSQVIERQRERLSGIESLLIEQEIMGIPSTLYMVKEMVDGEPTLVAQATLVGGMTVPIPRVALDAWSGSAELYGQLAERFTLDGSDEVHGRPAHRLTIDDFSGLDLGASDVPMTPLRGVFYVDRSDLVILRMELDMEIQAPSGETRVTQLISTLDDYRDVSGYMHPFRSVIAWDGLIEIITNGQSLADLEQQLAQLEDQLRNAPPAQRELFEPLLTPLRQMLSGAPMEVIVTRLEVNVDPPGGR